MKIKGAIFDFDGTLFDSMGIWSTAGEKYLESLGIKAKPGLHEITRNLSMKQTADFLCGEYGIKLSCDDIISGINKTVESFYKKEALPKKGVVQFLEHGKSLGVSMCIATVTERYLIEAALERFGMRHLFEAILTCEEVGAGKNEAKIYQKGMECLGTAYDSTIVFEDALYAIRTAKNAGFKTVSVFDESEKEQNEIKKYGDYFIKDYSDTKYFWESL